VIVRLHGSAGQIAFHDPHESSPLHANLCQFIETLLLPRATSLITYSRQNQIYWSDQLMRNVEFCNPPISVQLDGISLADRFFTGRGLVVGRVQKWKGPDTLCLALQELGKDAPYIDWIGRSVNSEVAGISYSAILEKRFPRIWGVKILWHPPEPPARIAQRQLTSDFVIVSSDWDVFNYTAAEAMARGCVLICSTGAGAADLIVHGVNGFVFQAGDYRGLAAVIREVLSLTPSQSAHIGLSAYQTISSCLHPDHVASITIEQYAQALKYGPPRYPQIDTIRLPLTPVFAGPTPFSVLDRNLARLELKLLLRHCAVRCAKKFRHFFSK
jgi:glycosyltransferase involved in cell wall biosynthesis